MEVGTDGISTRPSIGPDSRPANGTTNAPCLQTDARQGIRDSRAFTPPPIERPAPPKLLPIERVSAISWQGSAGAESYDVWRRPAANGPWEKIAENVSDADVQYRPLFHDDRAIPGESYWYRVVARNSAGDSEPSNAVGPVAVSCRTLVDECRDISLTTATDGKVSTASENARTVQEDCHRLVLNPGSAIVYRVDGPISRLRVYAFAATQANLAFAVSADGKTFTPIEAERAAFPSSQTVYGYSTPILFSGVLNEEGPTYLRIAFRDPPASEKEPAKASTSKSDAAVELSSIEIEYDRTREKERIDSRRCEGGASQLFTFCLQRQADR